MTDRSRAIGFLIHDNVTMIDVAGPADVFHHANAFGARYDTVLVSTDGKAKRASNGHYLTPEAAAGHTGALDTVIVPGAYGMVARPFEQELVEAVSHLTNDAGRIASVCTGAFLLAHGGLLNYRNATTHWTQVERFRRSYPLVRVVPDALFVQDGSIITSAGISSGVDLALFIVEEDYGPDVARAVVRQMIIFNQRPGGQSQRSVAVRVGVPRDHALRKLLDRITADPGADYSIDAMAAMTNLSASSLARLFQEGTNTTPGRYVEMVRIEAAQAMLQRGTTVAAAAAASGFGSAETMRRVFTQKIGMSPSLYLERLLSQP
ncbi:GlxA family transcriptional regulator [Arthrobacter sp. 2RAF6]|uniref:GlxA family transcriptional regulator n=1 Tax=Arthrobacter sp. 2RAF6 TaxID=3233002 RepID=UPI003F906E78